MNLYGKFFLTIVSISIFMCSCQQPFDYAQEDLISQAEGETTETEDEVNDTFDSELKPELDSDFITYDDNYPYVEFEETYYSFFLDVHKQTGLKYLGEYYSFGEFSPEIQEELENMYVSYPFTLEKQSNMIGKEFLLGIHAEIYDIVKNKNTIYLCFADNKESFLIELTPYQAEQIMSYEYIPSFVCSYKVNDVQSVTGISEFSDHTSDDFTYTKFSSRSLIIATCTHLYF